jgi:3-phenylpropionate/trans-cinnamate dioxygenase ferredoxin reductase subunit
MTRTPRSIVVIGGSLAGAKAAEAAREAGFEGRLILIGEEAVAPYERPPLSKSVFFSDQYDLGMEYVGHASADDALIVRGDTASREFIAFWHHDGIVTAAMNVNVWDVAEELKALIERQRPVAPHRLADPDIALGELAQ